MAEQSSRNLDTGRAGIILAGGRSRRFDGIDKATAPVGGRPMIHRVAASLDPAVDELVINCRADQRDTFAAALSDFDVRFAEDSHPDHGPVFGLRTAVRASNAEYAAILPCDMPLVPTGFISHLFGRVQGGTGVIPSVSETPVPLPSVVHCRAGEVACTETIRAGSDRLKDVMSTLGVNVLDGREVQAHAGLDAFSNVNTIDDLRALSSRR
ncbi:molybdenum cofactor guanylyltransferase [Haloferax mediterranei ATCC 33500]|uniref:Probable molybdenum cofactor guanylyltransferase n=2 Tax=Haloferax mediterranei (strain ATCC 33500 / DSM 1411 / JCM 8866 / NBRC 14739 / NCIMB 2177 / R-4) TaxID=523841 RepID=NASC_HALMT|nr:molybdenum cofactor guanylyltransferase [Haloferax mediterranei]I3R636.1 RecName: Full=Probable molybdenum cofactor guanylyltransferase; Short=MoCo guanylyltransferase; AltName: Full=GTP:molybdopterin guanylyltransferase; AltName: Full=Mo-MPT guanylyltransferase; AltName: Full=Molybdopterin guanylyltransferase; AltName: Full=Molybdopterin-guanine dinucleotide synthase; Short=MGD synthase [Haloferax mediterranei ATCC 33500]AFK19696.1 molybdopterin guanin biosynthesis protein A [Haloferax medite